MATKVNRDYWSGTINYMSGFPNADDVGYLSGDLADLINNDTWDIANNDEFDLSVCPWGIPECSVSSMAVPCWTKNDDNELHIDFAVSQRKNMPLFFNRYVGRYQTDTYDAARSRSDNKQRVVGDTTKKSSTGNIRYTTTVDTNDVDLAQIGSNTKPIVSLNYQSIKLFCGAIYVFDDQKTDNYSNLVSSCGGFSGLRDLKNTDGTGKRYKVVRMNCGLCSKSDVSVRLAPHMCGKHNIPEYIQSQYYNTDTTEYIDLSRNPLYIGQSNSVTGYGVVGYIDFNDPSKYASNVPTLRTSKNNAFGCSALSTCICSASPKKQVFDDVSYHWEMHLYYYTGGSVGTGTRFERQEGQNLNTAGGNSYFSNPVITLEIDTSIYNNYYDAAAAALLHELAFLGVPFIESSADIGEDFNSTKVYLPVFDTEHMMTTGRYKRGDQASDLLNFTWNDIFDTSVPAYDPNYTPPEPEPDQGDTGDLNNQQLHNLRYRGSNNYYLLNESELSQFIGFINGLYTGESDPEKKRSIDFMGSNPTDYIVGIYGCGIELFPGATTSIKLGAVDTSDAGIYGRAVPTNLTYVNFGNYDIPAYGNFLDFKPYTTIEVYVPLCGTIEVDPGEYIGHNLKVDGLIDYQTGELTARIVRDGKTVTNTLTGSMWVQLPVTAAKMGEYQNNQHQLRMQMLSSVLSFGQSSANAINSDVQSAAGAIAGSAAGGSPTALATPGKAQFTIPQNAASTALSLYNTHYQITHTQPARATASSASAGNALEMYHHAMVFIKRPTFLEGYDPETYAHTIGHACCISAKLSSFSGYTVFSAADLDNIHTKRAENPLQATAQEKQLLKQALQAGIYINPISPE